MRVLAALLLLLFGWLVDDAGPDRWAVFGGCRPLVSDVLIETAEGESTRNAVSVERSRCMATAAGSKWLFANPAVVPGVTCCDFCALDNKEGDCRSGGAGVLGPRDLLVSIASGALFRFTPDTSALCV